MGGASIIGLSRSRTWSRSVGGVWVWNGPAGDTRLAVPVSTRNICDTIRCDSNYFVKASLCVVGCWWYLHVTFVTLLGVIAIILLKLASV
jgi:hypothetical protein